jgi:hypothetical protein
MHPLDRDESLSGTTGPRIEGDTVQDDAKRQAPLGRWLAVLALALGAFPATAGAADPELPPSQDAR